MDILQSIDIMKSLADTSRLRILNSLTDKPQYVEELAHRLGLAASTVSFHLKKLESAGLISAAKEQYYIIYSINDNLFDLSLRELTAFDNMEKFAQDDRIEAYRQKILRIFFRKGRLTKLPVQKKKQLVVINEFAKKFKSGVKYPELKVDEIIRESYDDYCTIRRLLVEEGIMKRERQIYWLIQK